MIRSLPLFHRINGQRVVVIGEGEMGEAKMRLVKRAGGIPCAEPEAHHAKLAFIALEDEKAASAAAIRLKNKGLLVNVADRPDLCDFTCPSILDRDPVLIAIGTSGASAGLAKQLRLRLERFLPASLGTLAAKLEAAREAVRSRFPAAPDRRRALDDALGEAGILDPLDSGAPDRVDGWLAEQEPAAPTLRREITLTSDDPEDLTLRQCRLLGSADVILFDAGVPSAILDRARADALRRPLAFDGPMPAGLVVVLRTI